MRRGAAVLAAAHNLSIIPIRVTGTAEAMPPGRLWPRRLRGKLHVQAPPDHRGLRRADPAQRRHRRADRAGPELLRERRRRPVALALPPRRPPRPRSSTAAPPRVSAACSCPRSNISLRISDRCLSRRDYRRRSEPAAGARSGRRTPTRARAPPPRAPRPAPLVVLVEPVGRPRHRLAPLAVAALAPVVVHVGQPLGGHVPVGAQRCRCRARSRRPGRRRRRRPATPSRRRSGAPPTRRGRRRGTA